MLPFKNIQLHGLVGAIILASLMSLLWYIEKTRHAATASEYAAFIADVKAKAAIQKAENERMEANHAKRQQQASKVYQAKLEASNLDRQRIQRRLKDEIKRNRYLSDTISSMQNNSASSSGVSEISNNPERCPTTQSDSDRTINTLIDAGRSCHADYTYLYESWQAVCQTYGCQE